MAKTHIKPNMNGYKKNVQTFIFIPAFLPFLTPKTSSLNPVVFVSNIRMTNHMYLFIRDFVKGLSSGGG